MQNFGPVHIEKNIEHAAIVDASTNVTLAAQTNTQNNMTETHEPNAVGEEPVSRVQQSRPSSKLKLNTPNVTTVDYCRIIMAMIKSGFFKTESGTTPSDKEVFAAFASILSLDLSRYSNILRSGKIDGDDTEEAEELFSDLNTAYSNYKKDLIKKNNSRK